MFDTDFNETQAAPGLEALPPGGRRGRAALSLASIGVAVVTSVLVLTALATQPDAVGAQGAPATTAAAAEVTNETATTVVSAPATETVAVETTAPATVQDRFVELINELRRSEGLGELEVDVELIAGAEVWTDQLIADGGLSHAPDLSIGVTSYWLKLGENVGFAPDGEVEALFDAFVASPTHYANLVDPDFTHVGVAVEVAGDRIWTTHRFMALAD